MSDRKTAMAERYHWRAALARVSVRMLSGHISLVAAGCAFYATLALFPALSMLVFLYGLVFDPVTVEPQLRQLHDLLPPSVFALIDARVLDLVSRPRETLSIGFALSSAIAVWSAMASTKAMLSALNVVYRQEERRSVLEIQVTALTMTLGATFIAAVTVALLVLMPALLSVVGLTDKHLLAIRVVGSLVLAIAVLMSLALLYRFGPSRHRGGLRWLTAGACLGTVLWLTASFLFSLYVGQVAGYDVAYGPLAAAVGMMMWFWVSAYVVLVGAQIDAEAERRMVA